MQLCNINPYVRFFKRRFSEFPYTSLIYAYDFRLFYVKKGQITVETKTENYIINRDGVVILPPALGYRLIFEKGELEYVVVNFDFEMTKKDFPATAPTPRSLFEKEKVFSFECPELFSKTVVSKTSAQFVFDEIERGVKNHTAESDSIISGLMKYFLSDIASNLSNEKDLNSADSMVRKVEDYVNENIFSKITNSSIAKEMGYHPNYLNSRFLELTGECLHHYIEKKRISIAKELLTSTSMSIGQVAEHCGFADASYFVKFFVRHEGITPNKYKKLAM